FKIENVGGVFDHVVEGDGKQYIVRLTSKTEAHHRPLAEADRAIRVALIQQKMQERERALDVELRKKFPVEINAKALAAIRLPTDPEHPASQPSALPAERSAPVQ